MNHERNLPEGWSVLSSQYLQHEAWLTVRCEQLKLPNGHIIPRYFVLEYPDWVNTIAMTPDGQFVLVRQYRHAIGGTAYELCAGVADPTDATPMEAARRELLEETGYGGGEWIPWMQIAPNPATSDNWVHCFLARKVEKIAAPKPEPSEQISVHLFDRKQLKAMLLDGSIIQATHLAPLWKFFAEER